MWKSRFSLLLVVGLMVGGWAFTLTADEPEQSSAANASTPLAAIEPAMPDTAPEDPESVPDVVDVGPEQPDLPRFLLGTDPFSPGLQAAQCEGRACVYDQDCQNGCCADLYGNNWSGYCANGCCACALGIPIED